MRVWKGCRVARMLLAIDISRTQVDASSSVSRRIILRPGDSDGYFMFSSSTAIVHRHDKGERNVLYRVSRWFYE